MCSHVFSVTENAYLTLCIAAEEKHSEQGVYNQGNHGKVRKLDNSGKIMKNSVNFVKLSPNQGTLHFCLLNTAKKIAKQMISKEEARGERNEAKFKEKKKTEIQLKKLKAKRIFFLLFYDAQK